MARITVDVNEEWLAAAQEYLGTSTKVATINAALETLFREKEAAELLALWDTVELDLDGSAEPWRYGGGRDLSRLEERALEPAAVAQAG